MKGFRWMIRMALLVVMALAAAPAGSALAQSAATQAGQEVYSSQPVYVIPVESTIETGLSAYLSRAIGDAEKADAKLIVLQIDTLGGSIIAAENIGKRIRESPVPTVAFIRGNATSAGSYIALNADKIAMAPGSSIGAAEVVDVTGTPIKDAKVVAHWASEMKAAAEMNGRNPHIAEGMVDPDITVRLDALDRSKFPGEIISLSAQEALKVGYADTMADNLDDVLGFMQAKGHPVVMQHLKPAEQMARFLTTPWVSTLLLFIGLAGIAIEFLMPGVSVPGIAGVLAFSLYFFGHYIAGFAGVEHIVLFAAGILLMIAEIFVPSFGIIGISGIVCLTLGIVLAAYNTERAFQSLGIAFLSALVLAIIVARVFKKAGVWNRFILKEQLTSDKGYLSAQTRSQLLGMNGVCLTPLRPSGAVKIGDERVDVVTDGEFIPAGTEVVVARLDGSRIIVRPAR